MATGSDEIIVDEMQSPEGALRLVAYEQDGLLWIGVRSGLSTLGGALALHSGSDDHYVEAAGEGRGTWALVWGAVAPEIERVAVQDAQGQAVPATIIPLPDAFGESFRAAWGLAEPDTGSASLVGYDRRGRLVDANAIRPREPTSSTPMARLEQLRVQAHEALRYHATAYLAANDVENKRLHRDQMHLRADVLALVEEDVVDSKTMMSWRSSIITRHLEDAKTRPWTSPLEPPPGDSSFDPPAR